NDLAKRDFCQHLRSRARTETVADLRQFARVANKMQVYVRGRPPERSGRLDLEPLQLAVKRGAADAQRFFCCRYVALGPQQGALQDAALNTAKMLRRFAGAEQVRRRNRAESVVRRKAPREARGPRRADHEVVGINRKQSATL